MKILMFVDTHASKKALEKIKEKSRGADLLICAGDISIFEQNIKELLRKLDMLGKKILMLHGNHEEEGYLREQCSRFKNIIFFHKKVFDQQGIRIIGYGGGGFSIVDKGFDRFIAKNKKKLMGHKLILVTHAPPYNTKLDVIGKSHHGNKNIKNFILKYKPTYAISGHFHENSGKEQKIGKTIVMNPGPFGRIVEVN